MSSSFYQFRMLNLLTKFKIPGNAQTMLKAHEDWKTGKIDEAELGRLIRLSPENRASVIQAMMNTAQVMSKKPEESKHCLAIIEICGEIVTVADKSPPTAGFPSFLKLPSEIRQRIYDYYLHSSNSSNVMVPYTKKGNCKCGPHDPPAPYYQRNVSLAFASKQMRDEVLSLFYSRNFIYFSCACEMGCYLRNNSFMKQRIRKVKFHWCGAEADKGITELHTTPLESLIVVISKVTTKVLTKRERGLQECFNRGRNKKGFPEALGFKELSEIRGLQDVDVQMICKRRADTLTADDKATLNRWLQKLKG
ncbi:hypothetical protein BJ170DRAFT_682248 [Xylariales sp. AK1849]|nr:hypothetical protein BJ170DRAFT_682248 [Xylariales sp. AK1849]